jgi:phage baseplate assembly protein W
MAPRSQFPVKKNEKPRYSDFTMNLDIHPDTKQIFTFTNVNAVKRSIKNLVMTDKYERLFRPNIGAGIRALLFENMTSEALIAIKDAIKSTIENYEPRVVVREIEVLGHQDQNAVTVNLIFEILNIPDTQFLQISIDRAR